MLSLFISLQEDYDQVSLEEQLYQGDGSLISSKSKLPLRDSKKELLRYGEVKQFKHFYYAVKCV